MARGWESKSVEEQIDLARTGRPQRPQLTPEKTANLRAREGLQLQRIRIQRDLDSASNPHYRETLQAALAHLDERLAKLPE